MSVVDFEVLDYRTWVLGEATRSTISRRDVVLLCRLLNNVSSFTIEKTRDASEIGALGKPDAGRLPHVTGDHAPAFCLDERGSRPEALIMSNARVRLRDGVSFRQLSLTDYFAGLHHLSHPWEEDNREGAVFFPLRHFNPDALVLADGSSLLERLCAIGDLVLIEDVDLTAVSLCDHLRAFRSHNVAASDVSDQVRMPTAQLLCVTNRRLAKNLPGRRIW